jgi:toxoflavin synthase
MAEYNKIAKQYIKANSQRLTVPYFFKPSFIKYIGNVKNKNVLDLACGGGEYTRLLKKLGAKNVVGIDVSEKIIDIAKNIDKKEKLGIKYIVKDVLKLDKIGEFDIISAMLLLHYSRTKKELEQMCKNIYKNLRKSGKFITLNNNPLNPINDKRIFGSIVEGKKPFKEGDKLKISLLLHDKIACSFFNYYWKKQTYNLALKKAGFKNIKWIRLIASKNIKKEHKKIAKDYIDHPSLMFIIASK